jgi:hypothetical protein
VVRSCECGTEPSGSVKCGKFIDLLTRLRNRYLLKKDSAPWINRVHNVCTALRNVVCI